MNEDVIRHISQAKEIILSWNQHKESILSTAKGDDDEELINAGMNSFSFFYAAKYFEWNLKRYIRYPNQYQVDFSMRKTLENLSLTLKSIEDESRITWHLAGGKLKKSLPKSEWKKYLNILELKYGSSSYAVNLGQI